ncbi:MAG: PAS domain-containing protein, partial [Gammaproteobacteria bacterium]|nr:PAS domain-containing protein [Gammaproteobacteria bacterium]
MTVKTKFDQVGTVDMPVALLKKLYCLSPDILGIVKDAKFVYVNPAALNILGYSRDDFIRYDFRKFVHQDDWQITAGELKKLVVEKDYQTLNFENRHICKDGSIKWIAWRGVLGEDGNIYVIGSDVTQYKYKLEQQANLEQTLALNKSLEKNQRRFDLSQQLAKVGNWDWDLLTNEIYWSDEVFRIFGVKKGKVKLSKEFFIQCVHPDDRQRIVQMMDDMFSGKIEPRYNEYFRVICPDGQLKYVHGQGQLIANEAGEFIFFHGCTQDITEQISTEKALRESESQYRILSTVSPVGIFRANLEGKCVYADENLCELTGLTPEENLGDGWVRVVHPDDQAKVFEAWQKDQAGIEPFKLEFRYLRPDGSVKWVHSEVAKEYNAQGKLQSYVGAVMDIDNRKKNEEKLRQQQNELAHISRLNLAGEMISGIAHELNQPLTSIVLYIGGCLRKLKQGAATDELVEILQQISDRANYAGEIVHRLKNFLRRGSLNMENYDIALLISEALSLVEHKLSAIDCELVVNVNDSPVFAKVDKIQIQQVILNIIGNAIEAMEEVDLSEKIIVVNLEKEAEEIAIMVCDNGPGVAQENSSKVFDSFFTTKKNGMGIGLSLCRSIIEGHRGALKICSHHKYNSCFC